MRSKQLIYEPPAIKIDDQPPVIKAQTVTKKKVGIFTAFVNELTLIMLNFNKDDFVKFVKILNSEMKKYFSPKGKFLKRCLNVFIV